MLRIENVLKQYGDYTAVNHVSFDMPDDSILGLLGPNGAGKTSLIRMITGITKPDEGHIYFNNEPLREIHVSQIGYLPEERGLYKNMKVAEQLLYLARLKEMSKASAQQEINFWLEKFDMQAWRDKKIEELSKGMQQKIQFISTVLHRPKLLILDEPFSGLDPLNTNLIKSEIHRLNSEGTNIIFSTHRMESVEEMCRRIVLMNKGKVVLEGNVSEIKQTYKKGHYKANLATHKTWQPVDGINLLTQDDRTLTVQSDDPANVVLRKLIQVPFEIVGFEEILPSFNDIFIQRVSETMGEAEVRNLQNSF